MTKRFPGQWNTSDISPHQGSITQAFGGYTVGSMSVAVRARSGKEFLVMCIYRIEYRSVVIAWINRAF